MVERFVDYLNNPFSNLKNIPTAIIETATNNLWVQSIIATNTGEEDIKVNLKLIKKKIQVTISSEPTHAGDVAGTNTVVDGNVTTITTVTVISGSGSTNITTTTITVITILTEIFLAKNFLVPSHRNSSAQQNGILYNTADLVKILGLPINLQFISKTQFTDAVSEELVIYSNSPTQIFDCCVVYSKLNELPMR